MQFRLTYQGNLLSERTGGGDLIGARSHQKHEIRKQLHPQLKKLWEVTPGLQTQPRQPGRVATMGALHPDSTREGLSARFQKGGFRFVPLVHQDLDCVCEIDVLYLRAGHPGSVLKAGDLDNRLKTLLDALSMPQQDNQLRGSSPSEDEDPSFVLLEDDCLVTKVSAETDTLLQDIGDPELTAPARVIITVTTRVLRLKNSNFAYV